MPVTKYSIGGIKNGNLLPFFFIYFFFYKKEEVNKKKRIRDFISEFSLYLRCPNGATFEERKKQNNGVL